MNNQNDVSTFFYYMWNAFNKEECLSLFGIDLGYHIWEQYKEILVDQCGRGVIEELYSKIDDECRQKLVTRSKEVYDGRKRIN